MTLLSICQDVADEVQITRPPVIAGSPAPDSVRLLRYANKVGRSLMTVIAWQALRKAHTFTAVSGEEQTNGIPSDFDRFVPETFWNRSTDELISGPVTAVRWQGLKSGATQNYRPVYVYRGGSIHVLPALTAGQSLAFEYVSNEWAQSSGGTAQTRFQADTDTSLIDEELITLGVLYEWLRSEGQPFDVALADYMGRRSDLASADQPASPAVAVADIFASGSRKFTGNPKADNGGFYY